MTYIKSLFKLFSYSGILSLLITFMTLNGAFILMLDSFYEYQTLYKIGNAMKTLYYSNIYIPLIHILIFAPYWNQFIFNHKK
jgi:hypothetical protein